MTPALPITVIAGYLGAGKTTLVNHLLRHANGLRLAILVNDFGELPIDADLIEAEDEDIISIAGGCVCCSYGNDLTMALMDLAKMTPRPDHVLIEASGVAIPGAIVAAIGLLEDFTSDGIVILADAETIRQNAADKYMGDTVTRQLADADIVILNKSDLVTADELEDVKQWLADHTENASIVPVEHGKVSPDAVLESFIDRKIVSSHHHQTDTLDMVTLTPTSPIDIDQLAARLASGDYGVIRAKGFAKSTGGGSSLIQIVGRRWRTSAAAEGVRTGIVCLGLKGRLRKAELESLISENPRP